ncbi:serine--tRNA ligase [Patescibacteria group bacterium]|nr:MAG: serine--tRNA ligase [Patescibacteria group bacterium]
MIDIKFIRDNPDIVRSAIQNKKGKPVDIDELLRLNDERKELRQKIDEINRQRNEAASKRDIEGGKRLKEELAALEATHLDVEKRFVALMILIPNIPSPDTPIGADESENKILREVGEKRSFGSYSPRQHFEIGEGLGFINSDRAGEVSGARFAYLMGDLAMMQFALLNLSMKILTDEEILKEIAARAGLKVSTKPFIPVVPPYMMRPAVMNRMARLDPIDERYYFEKDDEVLIGSAEHTLGPLHMDQTIPEEQFPIRYVGYSPAFRREAGSYGKDTRGLIRMHHFDKVEMETFVKPEDGYVEQDFIVAIQEHLLNLLGLPYRVVSICTGDMGFPDQRQFDMDTWMPGQSTYRETHTSDYMGGFQARRLSTKIKRNDGTSEFVHMNDATLVAMGRTLAAILENYQEADGSVRIPKALQLYMGKEVMTPLK